MINPCEHLIKTEALCYEGDRRFKAVFCNQLDCPFTARICQFKVQEETIGKFKMGAISGVK